MSLIATHTAAGQLAGFLFQPERALLHLVASPSGSVVGIETLDDVAVILPDGMTVYEQDKHSVSRASPLLESNIAIWKTLKIWLAAVAAEEIALTQSELHLVTNKVVSRGFAFELIRRGRKPDDLAHLVAALRRAGKRLPKSVRGTANLVLSYSNADLTNLLERVRVIDGNQSSSGDGLKKLVATKLPLPAGHEIDIIQSLLGWVHDTALELIRKGEPAWLTREAFVERYLRVVTAFYDRRLLNETAEALIRFQIRNEPSIVSGFLSGNCSGLGFQTTTSNSLKPSTTTFAAVQNAFDLRRLVWPLWPISEHLKKDSLAGGKIFFERLLQFYLELVKRNGSSVEREFSVRPLIIENR